MPVRTQRKPLLGSRVTPESVIDQHFLRDLTINVRTRTLDPNSHRALDGADCHQLVRSKKYSSDHGVTVGYNCYTISSDSKLLGDPMKMQDEDPNHASHHDTNASEVPNMNESASQTRALATAKITQKKPKANAPAPLEIAYEDFKKVQLQLALVMDVERIAGTEKLYRLQLKTGETERQIISGLAKHYSPDELKGKTVVIVSNMKPVEMFGVRSDGMLLAASHGESLRILTVDGELPSGSRVS